VAVATITPHTPLHVLPASPSVISADVISRYAALATQFKSIEKQKDALRDEVLTLRKAGAEQETTSPYLLQFIDQTRRTVDWEAWAMRLAEKVYGEKAATRWFTRVKARAPKQLVTQVKPIPNPEYAANVASPPAKRPVATVWMPSESLAKSGD
jgi:hypothetical protein